MVAALSIGWRANRRWDLNIYPNITEAQMTCVCGCWEMLGLPNTTTRGYARPRKQMSNTDGRRNSGNTQ
jgi:hypothetical protein